MDKLQIDVTMGIEGFINGLPIKHQYMRSQGFDTSWQAANCLAELTAKMEHNDLTQN